MSRITSACCASALLLGCATAEATREADPKINSATAQLLGGDDISSSVGSGKSKSEPTDPGLRRSYALTDMKLHACASANDSSSVVGVSCPSSLVVFGPYVTVPAHSNVTLRFEVEAQSDLTLTSDVVSNSAKQFHGALDEQAFKANEKRVISYRIHVFDQVRSLETRIGIRSETPASFKISNLDLRVE